MKIIFTTYFLLFCALIFAQNNLSYRAFGRIQIQTPDSLIIDYKNSENSIQKYNATLAIIGFHNNNFSVDSTLWYANNFDNHIKLSDPNWCSNNVNKTDYLQYIKAESYRKKGLLDKSLGLYIPIIRSTKKSGNDSLYWMSYLGFLQTKFARNDLAGIKSEYNKIISNATEEKTKQLAYNELGKVFFFRKKIR